MQSALNSTNPPEVRLESALCPLCQGRRDMVLFRAPDRLHGVPGEYDVVRCLSCELVRTNPRPSAASIAIYYPEGYAPHHVGEEVQAPDARSSNIARAAIKRLFGENNQLTPDVPPGKLLEIGCGGGAFMSKMAALGWQVEGVEFSRLAATRASRFGYKVHACPIEDLLLPEVSFDLIVGWMVLEHLYDPVGTLRKLRRATKPRGWLAISVPDASCLEFKLIPRYWYALQVPTHLYHFDRSTIAKVVRAGGWRVERMFWHRSAANLLHTVGYVLENVGMGHSGRYLHEAAQGKRFRLGRLLLGALLAKLRLSGRLTVWARPSES
jgi:SAM-dependent methyltransferase